MSATIKTRILELLAEFPDGMTTLELATKLRKNKYLVAESIRSMDQVRIYIDRWTAAPSKNKEWSAVWCVVPVPANCPKPERVKPRVNT